MNQTKKRNIIIGSLCAVLLLMVVGYAAFSTMLDIKGTSGISSNWKILITKIDEKNIVGSASTSVDGTGNKKISGVGTLTATFETDLVSPGDSIEYDITVTNQGSLDARLDKITLTDSNNPAINFTAAGLTEGSILGAGESAVLTVKVEYDNNVTSQPGNTIGTLSVTLDYVQNDGNGGTVVPNENVVYRWGTNSLKIGESIKGIETTTNPATLGKSFYLKHIIDSDNKISASYVCFVTDAEYCLQGGSPDYFTTNKALLQSLEASFTANGGGCIGNSSRHQCNSQDFNGIFIYSNGNVEVDFDSTSHCYVRDDGTSYCS